MNNGSSFAFPLFILTFFTAFMLTAVVVKSTQNHQNRLSPTQITSDEIRSLSINLHLNQLYHEFNDFLTKISMCELVYDKTVFDTR